MIIYIKLFMNVVILEISIEDKESDIIMCYKILFISVKGIWCF